MKNKIPIQGIILVSILLLTVFIQIYVSKKNIEYNKYDNIYCEKNKPIKNIIIKNYLKKDMYDKYKWNYKMKHYRIAVIDMIISKEQVVSMINNSEVIEFIKFIEKYKNTIFIRNINDINSINDTFLSNGFSIIEYGKDYDGIYHDYGIGVSILSSDNIYEDKSGFMKKHKKFKFSDNEIKQGYGELFYRYILYNTDISYDDRFLYEKNNNKRIEKIKEIKQEHVDLINSAKKNSKAFFVVSRDGDILLRKEFGGYVRYSF